MNLVEFYWEGDGTRWLKTPGTNYPLVKIAASKGGEFEVYNVFVVFDVLKESNSGNPKPSNDTPSP